MKSPFTRNIGTAAVVIGLLPLLLAGCGQTGPLYMPRPPAKPPATATPLPPPPQAPSSPLNQ